MKSSSLLPLLLASLLASGCVANNGPRARRNQPASPPPAGPPPATPPGNPATNPVAPGARADEKRDDARDRKVEDRTGWDKLGERMVDGKVDRDTIPVGRADGRFSRVMLVVEHSALELFDVDIVFADGSKHSPGTRLVFTKDTRSRMIDLPGDKRVIKQVTFKYGNLPGGGRAQVELWAR
jgi:hypothetical protein